MARNVLGAVALIAAGYCYWVVDDWQQSLRPHSFAARFSPAIELLR
jgi:hypothetical protein